MAGSNITQHRRALIVSGPILVAILTGCTQEPLEVEAPLRPVRFVTVEANNGERTRTFSGSSRSTQISRLSFKVGGTVVEAPVEVGDRLKKGGLIARLDSSSFDLEVQQAQASLVQAQANQRNADSNYERVQGLYANNNASRNELDSARANAESARAQARSVAKALELARLNRSYTSLTAERDCLVAAINVDMNENVNAGTEVARVNCGDGLEIELSIPESLIADVKERSLVVISFSAIPGLTFSGTVTEVGAASSSGAPTFPVIVSIDGSERRLRAGLAADVTLRFAARSASGVSLVPLSALMNSGDQSYVFVAEPEGTSDTAVIRKKNVSIGELTDSGIEILDGVSIGDRVVTAGVSSIRDGQRVALRQ